MSTVRESMQLPDYHTFIDSIANLSLVASGSELHGVMCGYLCAGAISDGEAYLRALMTTNGNEGRREALMALFEVYAVSHQQIFNFDFEFQLLLPDDSDSLATRAQAFSEWCAGFTQGLGLAGVDFEELQEDEAREALQHLIEFADLDYQGLNINEEDENALMEVTEYARMAVLRIFSDLQMGNLKNSKAETAH